MVVKFVAVKPKQLNDDAIRMELLNGLRKAGTAIKKDLLEPTKDWEHKPKFTKKVSLRRHEGGYISVMTQDKIYGWVSRGTDGPYEIAAGIYTGRSQKKTLAFSSVFSPKTVPNSLVSSSGFSGPVDTMRARVEHPGIEARNFVDLVEEKWEESGEFQKRMQVAIERGAKKSGHYVSK